MKSPLNELINGGKDVKWILDLPYYELDKNKLGVVNLRYRRCHILHLEIYNEHSTSFLIIALGMKSSESLNVDYIIRSSFRYITQKICHVFPIRYDLNPEIFDCDDFILVKNSVFSKDDMVSAAYRLNNKLAEILNPFYIWATTHENNNNTSGLPKI